VAAVVEHPLTVVFTLPGGVVHRRGLEDLPNQRLAADLAQGLVAATHPHGPIRTRSVARQYLTTMRRMVLDLDEQGFDRGVTDLSAAMLVQYWLTCDYHRERRIRVVLDAYQRAVGALAEPIVRHLSGRRINVTVKSTPLQPYSDSEWKQLQRACTDMITRAHRAHDEVTAAALRGGDPSVHGVDRANLAWLLTRTGPLTPAQVKDRLGPEHGHRCRDSRGRGCTVPDRACRVGVSDVAGDAERHRPRRAGCAHPRQHRADLAGHRAVAVSERPHR
jgi:hypothetical protein